MADIKANLEKLKIEALEALQNVKTLETLETLRVDFLGKKGKFTEVMKDLASLPPAEKPAVGKIVNEIRQDFTTKLDALKDSLQSAALAERLSKEKIDVTLPGRFVGQNCEHPVKMVEAEVVSILKKCGFVVEVGPEVEHEFYNFDALNIPRNHPARNMQDTFYVSKERGIVLRTQTSPVQIRTMLMQKPPIRMISPGRVYRSDYDATHSPMFHQIEGLLVDKNLHMGDLKGTLAVIVNEFFGEGLAVRLRPSFFPFTEPSAEVDMQCCFCKGKGCSVCKQSGWIEIAGCGMVDPEVFKVVKVNMDRWRGFAFGFGLERLTMLKYGINDLRSFYESDHRYISQFARWRL